eukprot:1017174-Rhodomonas_salina.6
MIRSHGWARSKLELRALRLRLGRRGRCPTKAVAPWVGLISDHSDQRGGASERGGVGRRKGRGISESALLVRHGSESTQA